jgi:hypothetical protein
MTMKLTLLCCAMVACTDLFAAGEAKKQPAHPLLQSDTVVWVGLDYSLVRMIGERKAGTGKEHYVNFAIPDLIFPGMLEKWNALFLEERIERVANGLKKRVTIDLGGVTDRNKTAAPHQIILVPGPEDTLKKSHITQQDIADEIRSYKLENKAGLGLVFIVDRFVIFDRVSDRNVRVGDKGAVYVVFFDVATREIISSERKIQPAGGSTFRNYWFAVIKHVDSNLTNRVPVRGRPYSLMPSLRE